MLTVEKFLLVLLLLCFSLAPESASKDNAVERLISGDFSEILDIRTGERISESHVSILKNLHTTSTQINQELEWIMRDINGDGTEELIWRESGYDRVTLGLHGLFAIFSLENDETHLLFMRGPSARNFDFFTDAGYFATIFHISEAFTGYLFRFFQFDKNFDMEFVAQLSVLNFNDFTELDANWLYENHPYVVENGEGLYFTKTSFVNGAELYQYINQEHFEDLFEEMMGFSFESIANTNFWNDLGVIAPR